MCSAFVIQHGILQGATFIQSENFNARPADKTGLITGIVIHNISLPPFTVWASQCRWRTSCKGFFQNQLNPDDHVYFQGIHTLKVSAHLFIERNGSVTQFVNFNDRAWHAGQSAYLGRQTATTSPLVLNLKGLMIYPLKLSSIKLLVKSLLLFMMPILPTPPFNGA